MDFLLPGTFGISFIACFAAGMLIERAKKPSSVLACLAIFTISFCVTWKVVEQHTVKTAVHDTVIAKRIILSD